MIAQPSVPIQQGLSSYAPHPIYAQHGMSSSVPYSIPLIQATPYDSSPAGDQSIVLTKVMDEEEREGIFI